MRRGKSPNSCAKPVRARGFSASQRKTEGLPEKTLFRTSLRDDGAVPGKSGNPQEKWMAQKGGDERAQPVPAQQGMGDNHLIRQPCGLPPSPKGKAGAGSRLSKRARDYCEETSAPKAQDLPGAPVNCAVLPQSKMLICSACAPRHTSAMRSNACLLISPSGFAPFAQSAPAAGSSSSVRT